MLSLLRLQLVSEIEVIVACSTDFGLRWDIEKFDRIVNFSLCKVKMEGILVQNELEVALDGKSKKPTGMSDEDFDKLDRKARTSIQLCLTDEVLREVASESTTNLCT